MSTKLKIGTSEIDEVFVGEDTALVVYCGSTDVYDMRDYTTVSGTNTVTGSDNLALASTKKPVDNPQDDKVTAFGGTQQASTPTPTSPVDIVCNNGTLKARHESGLPLGYTLLDYIASNGNEYIDVGYQLSSYDEVKITAKWDAYTSGSSYAFGAFDGTSNFGVNTNSNASFAIWGSNSTRFTPKLSIGTTYNIVMKIGSLTINGSSATYTPSGEFDASANSAYLFWANGTSQAKGKLSIYSFQIYDVDNNLVRNMIPCRRESDSELGMYDLVNSTFYANASGSGSFTAGSEVSDPVEIYADGTTETITVNSTQTATAEMLLSIGNYTDSQVITTGAVTRKVGVVVLDGTESWSKSSTYTGSFYITSYLGSISTDASLCTHGFRTSTLQEYASASIGAFFLGSTGTINYKYDDGTATVATFKSWLAAQYAAGTPVIIVYPLATATTESVTAQSLTFQKGSNVVDISQASLNDLDISISYYKYNRAV